MKHVVSDFGGKVKEDSKDRYPDNYSRRPNESDYYVATNETTQPNRQTLRTKTLVEINEVDLLWIPRVNTVEGMTEDDIQKWGWKISEQGWVNYPDYQARIFRRAIESLPPLRPI